MLHYLTGFTALFLLSVSALRATPLEIIPPELRGALQPQVAIAPNGRVDITFGKGTAIYHVASTNGGRSFSPPTTVANLPKLALGMRRGPRISATDSTLVISAISPDEGSLRAWVSTDEGRTWAQPVQINDVPNSAREGLHAMAGDGKGFVIAMWLDLRNGGMELWSSTSSDGGTSWGANIRVYASPDGNICECCHPSVAVSSKGEIAVMWRNWLAGSRDMYLAMSRDGGRTFSAAQKLGEGTWKLNGCPMDGGAVAFDHAGQPLTTWRREKSLFRTHGGSLETLLAERGLQPLAFADGSGAAFAWQDEHGLRLLRASGEAKMLGAGGSFPAAAAGADGKTAIVVWEAPAGGSRTIMAEALD
ncbi:MAG TPA: sialidase family protein [Chthoniobacteraceae bacterium]|jgi:hypothetical protein